MINKTNIRHYINGRDYGEPRNWAGITIKKDFVNKVEDASINATELKFVLEANSYLRKRILNGKSGGVGIFEGEPYSISIGDKESPSYVFEGYLDFTDGMKVLGNEEIICKLKKNKGLDWLSDVADGFSFAYLYDEGIITDSDFVKVPYVINYIPDSMQLMMLSMSLYMMSKELIQVTRELGDLIALTTNAATPVVGVGAGLGAVVVTAWDIGDWVYYALKLILKIAYAIAIIRAIKELIEQIFEQILPPKRVFLGMTFKKMFEKFCEHLGLNFESSIPELNWVHIPQKNKKGGYNGETGFPANNGAIYTPGDLIREIKKMFNADYIIENGVFKLERKDFLENTSKYKIPEYFTNQERLIEDFDFNTDEVISNYNISWAYDTQDQNTLDDVTGLSCQAIISPKISTNKNLTNIKNVAEINLPFSIGKCKTNLTAVEKLAKILGRLVDKLTGVLGGGTNFAAGIESRKGCLLLTSHYLTVGKVVVMNGNKLIENQRDVVSSFKLWKNYHFINSHAEINGYHNQFMRKKGIRVPMTLEEFEMILKNNKITDTNGNPVYIDTLEFEPEKSICMIDIRINHKYTDNLQIKILK